jgi:hypothetical protein
VPVVTPKAVPKPFPVSSPARAKSEGLVSPAGPSELDISANLTFDDSISAISAHTLEAMARTKGQHRPDLSRMTIDAARRPPKNSRRTHEPVQLYKSRSSQSRKSTMSTPSKASQSTGTTESSSFEYWQKEEQKYWTSESKKEFKRSTSKGSRGSKESSKSPLGSSGRHPHEVFPYDAFPEDEQIIILDTAPQRQALMTGESEI